MKLRYENTADWKKGNFPRRLQRRWSVFVCATGLATPIVWSASGDQRDDQIGVLDGIYDGTLMPDVQVSTFRHIDRVFPFEQTGVPTFGISEDQRPWRTFQATVKNAPKQQLLDQLTRVEVVPPDRTSLLVHGPKKR